MTKTKFTSEKVTLIPGWMRPVSFYRYFRGIDIWKNKFDYRTKLETNHLIGFSIGANAALLSWKYHRNTKLILINPLIPKRCPASWILRWLSFAANEGLHLKNTVGIKYLFSGIRNAFKLIKIDALEIIRDIPTDNLFILRGSNDNYFFDNEAAEMLKLLNINVRVVSGAGHDWDDRFHDEINKIING